MSSRSFAAGLQNDFAPLVIILLASNCSMTWRRAPHMKKSRSKDEAEAGRKSKSSYGQVDEEPMRADLQEVIERHSRGLDERRPEAVERRRKTNQRTIRENIEDLCDGHFIEYGALAVAAQRGRRTMEHLTSRTPADGVVAGIGQVNGSLFGEDKARCMIIAYDYTVLAGTQGFFGHKKKDRMLRLAHEQRLPVVLFAEGGGGRPGDVDADGVVVAGLDLATFAMFARLSGKVPVVGVVSGRCFAGNAVLLGCCDVIIAAQNANIGMAGPVMIEGGGLGVFKPEDIGPMNVQVNNGVVDIAVADDAEAVAVARKYLSYFQGTISQWDAVDQRVLRNMVPEQRRYVYDVRGIIKTIADTDSFLELRPKFGPEMVTGLIRIEGKPFGVIANNCKHQAGAIEAEGADKAARLMQLCNAHGLPLVSLVDTPGFMVGPEIERRAQVRHVCRMFVVGSHLSVPFFTVFLRRGYGLGAQAMAKGGFHEPFFAVAWPTGEFGGMGLEGAVRAGFRKELESVKDLQEREALYEKLVGLAYERGKALNMASYLEIDAVIDPADTRKWIMEGLKATPAERTERAGHDFVDTW
jgi:acetyl-CoA carboxylase carboxyltransferase component